jgi:hypothetical protein
MDLTKEIQFSFEFVQRLVERGILSDAFEYDLDKARKEIEWKMRHQSVIIDNPDTKYPNQAWCIINIDRVGLAKIPVAETPKYVKAITIATPVTDSMCIDAYNSVYKSK